MLLDSNIVIYAAQPQHAALRQFIAANSPAVLAVSYVEVLGFHGLTEPDRAALSQFFTAVRMFPLDNPCSTGRWRCAGRSVCRWAILSWRGPR